MNPTETERVTARLALHLADDNFEACHDILYAAEENAVEEATDSPPAFIVDLDLAPRIIETLDDAGYIYIDDLRHDDEWKTLPNFGPVSIAAVERELDKCQP